MGHLKFKQPVTAPSFTPTPSGIALTDLTHSGTDGQIPIAATGGAIALHALSGDVSNDKLGVTAIGAGKVLETMLQAAATVGLGALRVAHFKYDFAVDGGAVGEIIPSSSPTLPAKAIIIGGIANVTTALLAAGGAATIAIGTHAGSAVDSLLTATAKATFSLNAILALNPVFTAASAIKMSVAGQVSITVATNALTAGVMEIFLVYFVAST